MRRSIFTLWAILTLAMVLGATAAQAQTSSSSNCKTIQGPGYYSQACGTNAQVSGGPGTATASTGPDQTMTVITPTPLPTPLQAQVVPLPTPTATVAPSSTLPRPAPVGLIGMLLRLLGLG